MKEIQSSLYKKAAIAFLLFAVAFGLFSFRTEIKSTFNSLFSSHYVHKSIKKQQHSSNSPIVTPTTPVMNEPSNKMPPSVSVMNEPSNKTFPSVHICKNQYGDNYEVAILEYDQNPKVKLYAGFDSNKNKIVAIKVRIHNYGIHPINISPINFTLKDHTGYEYGLCPFVNEKSELSFLNLDPDSTQEGWIFYQVPKKVIQTHVPLSVVYTDDFKNIFEVKVNQ